MAHHDGERRGTRSREAAMFHAVFLAPTVVIAALAALELALLLWRLLP